MVWCWWCVHPFDGESLAMPTRHDPLRNKFTTQGHFCSWSCMKSFAVDKFGVNRGGIVCGNIIVYRKCMYNKIGPVSLAPNRFKLSVFGGDMSIEEFRANGLRDEGPRCRVETTPHVDRVVPIVSTKEKLEEMVSEDKTKLKLKRTKPLVKDHADLESALGLIIKPK